MNLHDVLSGPLTCACNFLINSSLLFSINSIVDVFESLSLHVILMSVFHTTSEPCEAIVEFLGKITFWILPVMLSN